MPARRPSLLMIAYYFPPLGMGGVQRGLKFAKYLPEFGWDVTVVTPHPGRYFQSDETLLKELPDTVCVERVRAFDPAHWFAHGKAGTSQTVDSPVMSLGRAAREWFRWPDDKRGFAAAAVRRAHALAREKPFDIVWTSSPPPSIHLAGLRLKRHYGWIADFRDPWSLRDDDWGPTRLHETYGRRLRRRIVRSADRVVAAGEGIASILDRETPSHPSLIIHNGYDEPDFPDDHFDQTHGPERFTITCPGTFSHSSDPTHVLTLVRVWEKTQANRPVRLIHIGATLGFTPGSLAAQHGVGQMFEDLGYLSHQESITETCKGDAVVVAVKNLPGYGSNIPGRVYEALRTLRPFLLVASPNGAAARLVRRVPGCWVVAPGDLAAGCRALDEMAACPRGAPARTVESIFMFDRREQSRRLAALCETVRAERLHKGRR